MGSCSIFARNILTVKKCFQKVPFKFNWYKCFGDLEMQKTFNLGLKGTAKCPAIVDPPQTSIHNAQMTRCENTAAFANATRVDKTQTISENARKSVCFLVVGKQLTSFQ
jgi:hypothetical protein